MPQEVVDAIANRIRKTGKWPKICDRRKMTPAQCGEKIAAITEAKRKAARAGHGGTAADAVQTWTTYSQYFDEAMAIEETDGSVWLKVADHDAKLRNPVTNEMFAIDQTAWLASIGFWPSPLYETGDNAILANLDHKKNTVLSREEFDFMEAKYAWDDGVYVRVMVEDDELKHSLLDGTVRPSPEVLRVDDDDGDTAEIIRPTGLGLMWEGSALSPGAGAQAPPDDAVTLAGGSDDMSEDEGDAGGDTGEGNQTGQDQQTKGGQNQQPNEMESLKAQMAELKAQYEAEKKANEELLGKEKLEKEELLQFKEQQTKRNKEAEDKERALLLKKVEKFDKEYPNKDGSLDDIRRDLYFFEKVSKQVEGIKVSGPNFMEEDNLGLDDIDKMFEEGKRLEEQIFKHNDFSRSNPPTNIFTNEDKK